MNKTVKIIIISASSLLMIGGIAVYLINRSKRYKFGDILDSGNLTIKTTNPVVSSSIVTSSNDEYFIKMAQLQRGLKGGGLKGGGLKGELKF